MLNISKDILDGACYLNIHTSGFASGEIRGQTARNGNLAVCSVVCLQPLRARRYGCATLQYPLRPVLRRGSGASLWFGREGVFASGLCLAVVFFDVHVLQKQALGLFKYDRVYRQVYYDIIVQLNSSAVSLRVGARLETQQSHWRLLCTRRLRERRSTKGSPTGRER